MEDRKILALGFFDGVHRGHAELLRRAKKLAADHGLSAEAVSFSTHPSAVLQGQSVPLLSTEEERRELMEALGVSVRFLPFDEKLCATAWDEFLERLLSEGAAGFVVGYDFRFGYRGEGNAEKLTQWCAERGLLFERVEAVMDGGEPISSSRIRALLAKGEVAEATELLGHGQLYCGETGSGLVNFRSGVQTVPAGEYIVRVGSEVMVVQIDRWGIWLPVSGRFSVYVEEEA